MKESIKIQNLTVVLGRKFKALNDINLTIKSGKITGFIGPSGAGKTTLIRSIVGRQRITAGTLMVLGKQAGDKQLRKQVSYMTQESSVYHDLTVYDNLTYFATMLGIPHKSIKLEVDHLIQAVDLEAQKKQLVGSLSGGQKQRVSLAIALIGSPRILVLDEPTVGLDPALREQLWVLFRKLAAEGSSLVISSHVMDEAERCDDLVLIRDGEVLAHGTPTALRHDTGTDTVENAFMSLIGVTR